MEMDLINEISKHNSLTDAKTGKLSVLAEKLINGLYHTWEREGKQKFTISVSDLKKLVKMENNKDAKERIKAGLIELEETIELRDFKYNRREISWMSSSFVQKSTIYKDAGNYFEIELDPVVIEALKQKAGHTKIDLEIAQKFRSKYSFKLYEMFLRYRNLNNKIDNSRGIIEESLDRINERFGTTYKSPSPILRNLEKGAKQIKEVTGDDIYIFYNKMNKKFNISWQKEGMLPAACRLPAKRIREFAEWYYEHLPKNQKDTIFDSRKYIGGIIAKIKEDKLGGLDESYRGMMQHKYSINNPEDYYDSERGTYKDFIPTPTLPGL